jgi:protein TonB
LSLGDYLLGERPFLCDFALWGQLTYLRRTPVGGSEMAGRSATSAFLRRIDDNGRVVAVDPVGRADPAFLEAARKDLIAKWRYRPATEDGRPVDSSTVITLRFELEA